MSFPQPESQEHKHNLGKCPNATQRKALKSFRRQGLWDDEQAWQSRRENKVKFTPAVQELAA